MRRALTTTDRRDIHPMQSELTPEVVRAAIAGFQQERLQIDARIAELRAMATGLKKK
jgi:hypothetical protein